MSGRKKGNRGEHERKLTEAVTEEGIADIPGLNSEHAFLFNTFGNRGRICGCANALVLACASQTATYLSVISRKR
jgi:hypothetical protein